MDCQTTYSKHALEKHRKDVVKYAGLEALDIILQKAPLVYSRGNPDEVPERLRGIELERRRTTVKYRCKTLRVVIAKTINCFTIVTIFPDPEKQPDLEL
ncbi:hypothetical protein [Pyrobaculum aerophilum]|uniref:hypothetical protein n=1 Tax=Pyrobaculum aerophilum TaxID=13773 RepID=UPI002FD9EC4B